MSITLCSMCHGADLKGGVSSDPELLGPNIAVFATPGGWTGEQFRDTIRTGVTPYGKGLDPEKMPRDIFQNMTDEELDAIWLNIQSLAAAG